MSETLHTCPVCHIPNFTQRGLAAHKCKGGTRRNPDTGLVEIVKPPSPIAQATAAAKAKREASSSGLLSSVSESSVCDVVAPTWDRARAILGGITLALRLSIAGQVMLGFELLELKKALGFLGSGSNRREKPQVADSKSWAEWVKAELEISVDSADRMINMWKAAVPRLKKLGGIPVLIDILERSPADLDAIQRQTLEAGVAKITDGESQKSLLEELRLVKRYDTSGIGGDTSAHRKPTEDEAIGQLAFAFFSPVADALQAACTHHEHPARLLEMEHALESALHDVRAAKATRVNPR
jgi:hypothetical protein